VKSHWWLLLIGVLPLARPLSRAQTPPAKDALWWDVTAYGADPRGNEDSTAAFNNQLAKCLSTGGTVFAPAGSYRVSGVNMTRLAYSDVHCTLAGAGRNATILTVTQSGGIGIDALGASNITVKDLTVTTNNIVAQTGLLLARSTTSRTAGFNVVENVSLVGMYSNCALVSIAAETSKRYNVHIANQNRAGPYPNTAFCTSGSNDFGITSPNGTIYASTNTDNETYGDEFYCDQGDNAICSIYSNGGGWRHFGSSMEVSNNGTGGIAVQLQLTNLPGVGNVFNGPIEFFSPHIEGNQPIVVYMKGIPGTYNYFSAVRLEGGNYVLYAPTVQYLVSGNDSDATATHNTMNGWTINRPHYIGGSGLGVLEIAASWINRGTRIDLKNPNQSGSATIVTGGGSSTFWVTDGSTIAAEVINEQGKYTVQQSVSNGIPVGGYFAVGHLAHNQTAAAGGPLGWVVTTAGYAAKEAWAAGHSYTSGDYVTNASKLYFAVNSGTAGARAPTHSRATASDGMVTWLYVAPATTPAVFTPLNGYRGTTGSIGGSLVAGGGGCASGSVTIAGVAPGMVVHATPSGGYPGNFMVYAVIPSANTVKVAVCNLGSTAATPTALTYNVSVTP
jgi:hypothetical protein